jgi:hypothetical protein
LCSLQQMRLRLRLHEEVRTGCDPARMFFPFSLPWLQRPLYLDLRACCCHPSPPPCCPVCRFHSAPVCDPTRSELNIQPDCVDRGCNSTGCTYRLALPRAPGTTLGWVVWIVFLMRRPHSIRFARAQGIPKYKIMLRMVVWASACCRRAKLTARCLRLFGSGRSSALRGIAGLVPFYCRLVPFSTVVSDTSSMQMGGPAMIS